MSVHGEQSVPRPTIHDVAERAGVSKSLVSLVLRGSSKVSSDRRAAVDRAITELGYRPNAAARTLREGRSRAIGVLLNDVRHPWFFDLLDGLISVLEAEGRHVVLSGGGRLDRAPRRGHHIPSIRAGESQGGGWRAARAGVAQRIPAGCRRRSQSVRRIAQAARPLRQYPPGAFA